MTLNAQMTLKIIGVVLLIGLSGLFSILGYRHMSQMDYASPLGIQNLLNLQMVPTSARNIECRYKGWGNDTISCYAELDPEQFFQIVNEHLSVRRTFTGSSHDTGIRRGAVVGPEFSIAGEMAYAPDERNMYNAQRPYIFNMAVGKRTFLYYNQTNTAIIIDSFKK